jgi:hypothetical protein
MMVYSHILRLIGGTEVIRKVVHILQLLLVAYALKYGVSRRGFEQNEHAA